MIREGWQLTDTCFEEGLGSAHLFFEREIANGDKTGYVGDRTAETDRPARVHRDIR